MPLETPTIEPNSFFSAHYKCSNCNHETEIFLSLDYDFYNICNAHGVCACCNKEKDMICSGDLIWRYDWPEPDTDPWQLQCAYIPKETGHCGDCKQKYNSDYKNLTPTCSK